MLSIIHIVISLQIGVIAAVAFTQLTRDGYILSWYGDFLNKIEPRYPWLAWPLGFCEKCFAGQTAVWFWLIDFNTYGYDTFYMAFFKHVSFIMLSIFFTSTIKKVIK